MCNCLPQWLLLLWCLSIPPGPRGDTPSQTQWTTCLLTGPCPRQPQEGHTAPSIKKFHLGTRYSNRATQKHSPWMACMIYQRSSGIWLRPLGYWAWPFTKSQEVWKGPDELQQANYTLRSILKGLKFL